MSSLLVLMFLPLPALGARALPEITQAREDGGEVFLMAKKRYRIKVFSRNANGGVTETVEMADAESEEDAKKEAVRRVRLRHPNNQVWTE